MHVCVLVRMYVCMYIYIYACMYVSTYEYIYERMYVHYGAYGGWPRGVMVKELNYQL